MPTPPQPALVARSVTMPGLVVSWLFAAAACGGAVPTESAPEPQVAANVRTPAGDSAKVTLTYLCGTRWRVRSTAPDTLTVTWDVYRTAETGTLLLPARPAGAGFSEVVFETVQRGTVRLFYQGRLIQTKANGGTPCTAPLWPVLQGLPALDDTKLFPATPERPRYYRTDILVVFKQEATDQQMAEFLARYGATVIGRMRHFSEFFYIRIPDPGDDYPAFNLTLEAMKREPIVNVTSRLSPDEVIIRNARFPADGPGWRRADWLGATGARTWAQRAIRLPLAWGCATGLYDARRPRVALIEQSFFGAAMNDDLDSAAVRALYLAVPQDASVPASPAEVESARQHASAVLGSMVALGDNTLDAYGALTLLARERPQRVPLCGQEVAVRIIDFPAAIEVLRGPAPSR